MSSVPRIVVVDAAHHVTRIVRGALALLSRPHILIEVPSSEDALEELARAAADLVVTAYDIPGELHGIDLAMRISHASLGSPVIVLAEEGDPRLDQQALKEAPFQYFVRPVGEPFLRGMRIALDGEAVIAEEQIEAKPGGGIDLGPVPNIGVAELRKVVISLMRDVGAMGIILADRTGRVLVDEGATGYIDREKLAVVLGPAFARQAEISPLVGGNAWTMHYYDGERLDVFGLSLGVHHFMCLIFEGSNRAAFGAVMMFGRRAADQMIEMIGETAYLVSEPTHLPPLKEKSKEKKEKEVVPEIALPAPRARSAPKREVLPEPEEVQPTLEPVVDFDPDMLFGQAIDERLAESMFDPDTLSNIAAALVSEEGEQVGYDEAVDMGILDE